MPIDLTPEAWAQIRQDYEHTDRPVDDICAEHGISSGTLRNRVRRWGWMPRRLPIASDGPPALPPPVHVAAPPFAAVPDAAPPSPHDSPRSETGAPSPAAATFMAEEGYAREPDGIVPRLQGAVARVLPAIEATVARLAAGAAHPREIERAGRALAALTRTLRELTGLLEQRRGALCPNCSATPKDVEELRASLMRKLEALVAGSKEADRPADDASAATTPCVTPPAGP